ncbi:MAG: hypothetical protein L0287_02505 [Anaerolineae bacterium]|nr:hypothetical protein [Anaerolineae bacterium]MCI0607745.1 hypothetical protein [Anaerolineae bacterium]
MDYMYPDHLEQINRQKIERDQAFILKEEMLKSRSGLTYFLNLLGGWMISSGEKLKKRNSFSTQVRKLDSLQDASRIFKS